MFCCKLSHMVSGYIEINKPGTDIRVFLLLFWPRFYVQQKDKNKDKNKKYQNITLSFFFHVPFYERSVPIHSDVQIERGREKVQMREICEWSLGFHPRCSNVCSSLASNTK